MTEPPTIYTIGHSNRSLADFLALLHAHEIAHLVDVRKMPYSRKNPQFNRDTLAETLPTENIVYTHMPGLGGMRRPVPESVNLGWQNESFRAFADYMQTAEFEENITRLIALAEKDRLTIMCAEAVPWRCHRSLIADGLLVRGCTVLDILALNRATPHQLTSFAKVSGTTITYPP